jgi:hypothetical protein
MCRSSVYNTLMIGLWLAHSFNLVTVLVLVAIQAPFVNVILRRRASGARRGGRTQTSRASLLERRYFRLLSWYPAEHRRVHGDEMAGVLMAGSGAGQSRPGLRQTLDLIRGGLLIRLRPGRALSDANGWPDSLALFSVMAPVLVLSAVVLSYWADEKWSDFPGLQPSLLYLVLYGQALVVPLVLLRLRRTATVVSLAQVLAVATLAAVTIGSVVHPAVAIAETLTLMAASLAEVAALFASPGPARGLQLLRLHHGAVLVLAIAPATALMPTLFLHRPAGLPMAGALGQRALEWATVGATAALVLILAAAWFSSAGGKRMSILFAGLAYPYVLATVMENNPGALPQSAAALASVPIVVLGCLTALAGIRSIRGGPAGGTSVGPHSGEAGPGPI